MILAHDAKGHINKTFTNKATRQIGGLLPERDPEKIAAYWEDQGHTVSRSRWGTDLIIIISDEADR